MGKVCILLLIAVVARIYLKRFKGSLGGGRKQHCHLVDERENSLFFIIPERQRMPWAGPHRGLHLEVG